MAGKGFKLADAYVEVHGDGTKVADDVAKDADGSSGKLKGTGAGMAKTLIGGFIAFEGFKMIGSFLGDSITQASDLSESLSKAGNIFGQYTPAIEAFGNNAAKNIGMSKAAAVAAAASFGDMFTQIGFTGDAAAAMSQQVLIASADLGSFSNLDTADVADRITAAFRGEYDSLQAVIPNINAARVESEALAMTGKTVASELTAQEKATAVLAIVQKDGAKAMGDFARTSDGVANQQKIAAAQTEDLKASIGESLLPVVATALGVFNDVFIPILQGVAEWITKNADVIGILVPILGILAAAIWVVNVAMSANPISLIIMGVMALIAAIVLLVTNWDTVVAWLTEVWQGFVDWIVEVINGFVAWWNEVWAGFGTWISEVWNGFVAWIQAVWQGFIDWIIAVIVGYVAFWQGVWTGVGQFFADVWNGLVAWVTGVWQGFLNWIVAAIQGWVGFWYGVWSGVASFIGGIWSGIVSTATNAWNGLVAFIGGIPGAIAGVFNGAINWLVNVGSDIVSGLWNGISGAWDWLLDMIAGAVGGIVDFAKGILGIASPSRVFRYQIGQEVVRGAELGIEDRESYLHQRVRQTFDIGATARDAADSADARAAATWGVPTTQPGASGREGDIHIGTVVIEASQLSDMATAIETLKNLKQAARQGQGKAVTVGKAA